MNFQYDESTYESEVRGAYKTGGFEIALNCEFNMNLELMKTADLGTFLHEYVHFLQNISTPWGIHAGIVRNNDLCEMVHSMEPLEKIHLPYKFEPSLEQKLRRSWLQCSIGTGHSRVKIGRTKASRFYYREIDGFPIAMHEVIFSVKNAGVADVKEFNYNGKIIDTKVNLNAKELVPYVFENNPKFFTDEDVTESKKIYKDYSQEEGNSPSNSKGMGVR